MRKLISMSPAALLMLTACGSRGTHDDEPVVVTPVPVCEVDDDCGDGALCYDGTCVLLAETDAPDDTPPPVTTDTAPTTPTGTSTTGDVTTSLPDPEAPTSLSGVWVGYLEGALFPSGSDVVRLVINADDCTPTASLTLGEGEPLPPVTDPDVGYPADFGLQFPTVTWYEGYEYAADGIELGDKRVQLSIGYGQVWTEWCELQEPILREDGYYSCVDATGWSFNDGVCTILSPNGDYEHDCGHLSLCAYGACGCDASGCEANAGGGASLDVALDEGHLEGTLTGFGPVRLYREE